MSSSSDRDEREIDEYNGKSNSNEGSSSSKSNSESSPSDEVYSSSTPRVPLKVFQEEMRKRATLGSFAGPSTALLAPIPPFVQPTDDVLACCALNIPPSIDANKLHKLKDKYQIPDDVQTHLPAVREWCCTPNSPTLGIYDAYMLGGLRLPLNALANEIVTRLGIAPNQLNPNGWQIIMAMQVLWRKVFEGNCPLSSSYFIL